MKRIISFVIFVLTLSLVSCSRSLEGDMLSDYVKVSVDVINGHTDADMKSVSDNDRDKIHSLNILVFSSHTHELLYRDELRGTKTEFYLQKGVQLECAFIVNAPSGVFNEVSSLYDLKALSSKLSDNRESNIMQGYVSRKFSSDTNLEIEVSRLVSRLYVGKVSPVFVNNSLADAGISFKRIFLYNVCEAMGYLGDIRHETLPFPEFNDLSERDYNIPVTGKTSLETNEYFYCYSSDDPQAKVSKTMLVLELVIGGKSNYYSIELPALLPNQEYRIHEIRLLGLGTDEPGIPIVRIDLDYSIEVNPWGENNRETVMN